MRKRNLSILLVLLFSFLSVLPLLQRGFFPVHDDTQVARVFEMTKALRAGEFPVRWVPDLGYGYGYPIFNFYAPLAYYVGAIFALLGVPSLAATKLMIGVGMLLAGVGMYLLAKQFFSQTASYITALLYVYAPYHAVNLYVRGAIAELWAYAFVPFTFYGFYRLYRELVESKELRAKNKEHVWLWIAVAAFSYAGIILSHNLTALMVTPFLFVFLVVLGVQLYRQKKISALTSLLVAFVFGGLLSAFYWLPALLEMKYTNVASVTGGGSQYKDHFVCLMQLWSSQWGFGGSAPGCLDGLSFQLGKVHILLGGLSLVSFLLAKKKQSVIYLFAIFGALISIFMLLPISKPVWDSLFFMKFLQFPWRYLGLALFFLSLLGGYTVWVLQQSLAKKFHGAVTSVVIALVLSVGICLFYGKYFKPQIIIPNYRDETDMMTLRWTISKISDEYLPPNFVKPTSEQKVASKRIRTSSIPVFYRDTVTGIKAFTDSPSATTLQLNLAVFPAWTFQLDGKPIPAGIGKEIYEIAVPAGKHTLDVSWQQTLVEKFGNALSLIGLGGLLLGIILERKQRPDAKTP
jgi:uncharacterized membrane protein